MLGKGTAWSQALKQKRTGYALRGTERQRMWLEQGGEWQEN